MKKLFWFIVGLLILPVALILYMAGIDIYEYVFSRYGVLYIKD